MQGAREERMRGYSDWSSDEFLPAGARLFDHLLRKGVPVYVGIDLERQRVYRHVRHELPELSKKARDHMETIPWANVPLQRPEINHLIGMELRDDIAYLRLDPVSVERLALSTVCRTPRFSGGGLAMAWPHLITGVDSRGRTVRVRKELTQVSDLIEIDLEQAYVVDLHRWEQAKQEPGIQVALNPMNFLDDRGIRRDDLFLDIRDIAALKQSLCEQSDLVECPIVSMENMPGIYWMFQAAHKFALEADSAEKKEKIKEWLKVRGGKVFNSGNLMTASNFAMKELNRSQGGPPRPPLNLNGIKNLKGDRVDYEYPFASKHLSMILAIADWWIGQKHTNPKAPILELAKTLMANGFAGYEVSHLAYFISREQVTVDHNRILMEWSEQELGVKPRPVMYIPKP